MGRQYETKGELSAEQKATRWLKRGVVGLLLLCTFACAVQTIAFFFPFTYLGRDRLNDVSGEVEVVLSSRRGAEFATLSPDKRWMAVNVAPSDRNMNRDFPGDLLIDLETETAYLFPPARGGLSTWMDSEHVLFNAGIVRVTDFMHWGLEPAYRGPFDSIESFPLNLVSQLPANKLFFDTKESNLFVADPSLPYIMSFSSDYDKHLINEIPHTPFIVGLPWNIPNEFNKETINPTIGVGDRFYSPDGRYYMEYTAAAGSRFMSAAMFDLETGEQVAHAYKYDWRPNIVGWAADSSGAFVLFGDNGQDGGLLIKLLAPGAEKGLDLKEEPAPTSPPLPPTYTPPATTHLTETP